MNREIKFRGKISKDFCNNFFKESFAYGSVIYCNDDSISTMYDDRGEYEVLTETVGQFTGLKDKNSVDIYENDIVRCFWDGHDFIDDETTICVVEFNSGQWCAEPLENYEHIYSSLHCVDEIEIIGNIYENQELLNNKS